MKEIRKNIVTEVQKTIYVSDDGKEFEKRDACIWYEKSVEFDEKFKPIDFFYEVDCKRYYVYRLDSVDDYKLVRSRYCCSRCHLECNKNITAWKFPVTIFVQEDKGGDYDWATVYLADDLLDAANETIEDANSFKDFINSNK